MKLLQYIKENHDNNKAAFGRSLPKPVVRMQVDQWAGKGFIVFEGKLYSPRRDVIENSEEGAK